MQPLHHNVQTSKDWTNPYEHLCKAKSVLDLVIEYTLCTDQLSESRRIKRTDNECDRIAIEIPSILPTDPCPFVIHVLLSQGNSAAKVWLVKVERLL